MRTEIPAEKRAPSSDPHEQPSSHQKFRAIVVAIGLSVAGLILATILGTGGLLAAIISTGGTLAMLTTAGTIPLSATIASLILQKSAR